MPTESIVAGERGRPDPTHVQQPTRRRRGAGSPNRPAIRWALIAPTVVLLLVLTVYPFFYALWISTHKWKTTFPHKPYIGADNYTKLLTDDDRFTNAVQVTLLIGIAALVIEFLFGLGLAIIFWQWFHRVRWLATVILLPLMVAPVVVGFTARMAFTDSYGFVNQILSLFWPGDVDILWLSDPSLSPLVVIAADAWQWGPFVFLLLLAGLLSSSGDEVEAAIVDGAGTWQLYRYVVLPGMKYILIVAVVLRGLDLIKMFDVVALATRGGPGTATETLVFYIYNLAFKFFDLGLAAAAAMLMLVAVSVLVTLAVRTLVRGPAT